MVAALSLSVRRDDATVRADFSLPGIEALDGFALPEALYGALVESDFDACAVLHAAGPDGDDRWRATRSDEEGPLFDHGGSLQLTLGTDRRRALSRAWRAEVQLRVGTADGEVATRTWRGALPAARPSAVPLTIDRDACPLLVPEAHPCPPLACAVDASHGAPPATGLLGGVAGANSPGARCGALDERLAREGVGSVALWAWHPSVSRGAAVVRDRRPRARPSRDALVIVDAGDRERRELTLADGDAHALAVLPDGRVLCLAGDGRALLTDRAGRSLRTLTPRSAVGPWPPGEARLTEAAGLRLWARGGALLIPDAR